MILGVRACIPLFAATPRPGQIHRTPEPWVATTWKRRVCVSCQTAAWDFPPISLHPTSGRAGRADTGGDAEGRQTLSSCRLRTSRAVHRDGWGCGRTCGEALLRTVKSPALPSQVRILSLPLHLTSTNRAAGCPGARGWRRSIFLKKARSGAGTSPARLMSPGHGR